MHKVIILSLGVIILIGGIIMAQQQGKNPAEESSSSNLQQEDEQSKRFDCLPDDVTLKDVVTYHKATQKNITVKDKLLKLKAQCENGKLVDEHHKEIRFFRVQCWGTPCRLQRASTAQQDELKEMERNTVVVMGCNPLISEPRFCFQERELCISFQAARIPSVLCRFSIIISRWRAHRHRATVKQATSQAFCLATPGPSLERQFFKIYCATSVQSGHHLFKSAAKTEVAGSAALSTVP